MPRTLNELQNNRSVPSVDLATMHVTYMRICSELHIAGEDRSSREAIARVVVQLHRHGRDDFTKCLAAARSRLG